MHDDDDAKAILTRRARYVAMALAGVGTATLSQCAPCLTVDVGHFPTDASRAAELDAVTLDATDLDGHVPSSDADTDDAR